MSSKLTSSQQKTICSQLGRVKLQLLYKASIHGFTGKAFHQRCDTHCPTVSVGYNASGYVFGGYTKQPFSQSGGYVHDDQAFLFTFSGEKLLKYPVTTPANAVRMIVNSGPYFGEALVLAHASKAVVHSNPGQHYTFTAAQMHGNDLNLTECEVYEVEAIQEFEKPWRPVVWENEKRAEMMESIKTYCPVSGSVSRVRVLLIGPVGAGKSSFFNSINSVFRGHVSNQAIAGCSTQELDQIWNLNGDTWSGQKSEQKTSLMKTVSSYKPSSGEVTQAQVLLLGPVGSGKSSFISSVQSVFNGRVTNRAMVGSSSTSFTKKLQSFNIHGQRGEDPTGLVLCDMVGLGGGEMTGPTLHDIMSIIKGHAPEGHKFSPDQPVRSETMGYVKRPSLKDKIHCVAFVVDASKILAYPKGLSTTFQQLREHISDLGVHQVALLTHIDQVCSQTYKDVTQVYKSHIIRDMMVKAASLLGMSTSYIIPVRNYSSELDLDVNTDVLLLSAVDHILQYTDLYFQDNTRQNTGPKID